MSTKCNILLLGATGYIGGSVLLRLLDHPNFASFRITALVRSREKWDKLRAMGINTVLGSLSDLLLLEGLGVDADVVVSVADADNLEAISAILRGTKKRHTNTGTAPIFIHTSGAAVFADLTAAGHYTDIPIYDDFQVDQIVQIPISQPHRRVDLALVNADEEGYCRTYIILPGAVYGLPRGRLVAQGIQNSHSIAIPSLVRAAIMKKRGGMIGPGSNYWPNVNVDDVADLYIILFNTLIRVGPQGVAHGREGFYFAENGEHTMYDVGKAICEGLITMGVPTEREPATFTEEELKTYFGGSDFLGSNCRCRGKRSRSIGWNPVKTTQDMIASIMPEIEETFLIRQMFLAHSPSKT